MCNSTRSHSRAHQIQVCFWNFENLELEDDGGDDGFSARGLYARSEANDTDEEEAQKDGDGGYSGSPGKDYDRDPELGNILGSFLENPQEAQSKVSITLLMVW